MNKFLLVLRYFVRLIVCVCAADGAQAITEKLFAGKDISYLAQPIPVSHWIQTIPIVVVLVVAMVLTDRRYDMASKQIDE